MTIRNFWLGFFTYFAFFAVMGWTGLTLSRGGIAPSLCLIFALLAGFGALLLVAFVMKWLYKSQHSGNMDLRNALGVSGTVYITIPPARADQGKVNLMLQGQFCELSAVTDQETPIPTGTEITVVGISGANTLVVKRKQTIFRRKKEYGTHYVSLCDCIDCLFVAVIVAYPLQKVSFR